MKIKSEWRRGQNERLYGKDTIIWSLFIKGREKGLGEIGFWKIHWREWHRGKNTPWGDGWGDRSSEPWKCFDLYDRPVYRNACIVLFTIFRYIEIAIDRRRMSIFSIWSSFMSRSLHCLFRIERPRSPSSLPTIRLISTPTCRFNATASIATGLPFQILYINQQFHSCTIIVK